MAANLMRHVLSWAKLTKAGINFSFKELNGSTLIKGYKFSIKLTITSVLLFFNKIETMGTR